MTEQTDWEVRFGVTSLGGVVSHISGAAPGEVRRVFASLAPALAWLYPGPREAKAQNEVAALREKVDALEAVCEDEEAAHQDTLGVLRRVQTQRDKLAERLKALRGAIVDAELGEGPAFNLREALAADDRAAEHE